jgi:Fe-S cluster assembly protein SufA/iron-sulfur cluster assembly protein
MSVSTFDPSAATITMTDAALAHFQAALKGREDMLVRLSTKTSGCTGYAYVLDLVDQAEPNDVVLAPGEHVRLAVDPEAMALVKGTEIDMVVEGVNKVIKFNNPNVVAECGCGESFSVS